MAKRLHESDKWDDKWFRPLKPNEKLVFLFLIDKCDLAGFYEVDLEDMRFRTGLPKNAIELALQGLNRGILGADNKEWIWVKNFVKQQKNLPLNPANNAHKHIIQKFKEQYERFKDLSEFKEFYKRELGAGEGLIRPIDKGIGTGISIGKNDEDIKKIWRKVYKTLPGIVEMEFVNELIEKFEVKKAELIVKEFKSKGFNVIDTMRRSLNKDGTIKPKNGTDKSINDGERFNKSIGN